ncbi:hypothetical protein PMAYCL1PPCAC_30019, partial [Pristionchus mayeri]
LTFTPCVLLFCYSSFSPTQSKATNPMISVTGPIPCSFVQADSSPRELLHPRPLAAILVREGAWLHSISSPNQDFTRARTVLRLS